jgi:urocanate hydratase
MEIALAFNRAVREGRLTAPVVLSRDHHDVSGTDSPFRETSNITDGSMFCADMAIQNVIGDSFRGATWVSIHNGGGTGWGEAVNGGFGYVASLRTLGVVMADDILGGLCRMVLDGSLDSDRRSSAMLHWDVINGVCIVFVSLVIYRMTSKLGWVHRLRDARGPGTPMPSLPLIVRRRNTSC